MPQTPISNAFCQILSADIRVSLPDVMNDQNWELCPTGTQPRALSLLTTYGFRASRMHVFPAFSLEDRVITDPSEFSSFPEIVFSSTNFTVLKFSPFQDIDVFYRLWVPTSQIIVGELTCLNNAGPTKTLGVDWLTHLIPVTGGSPMKQMQMGLSNVLQGECADLFPVFYLAGGAYASSAAIPGLAAKLLLMPASEKRLTWALASHTSIDASFQQARQFSSKSLEVEQLKIEMTDKPQGHGYVMAQVDAENPLFPVGTILRGHEFHNSRAAADSLKTAYRLSRGNGVGGGRDGFVFGNILASYTHLHVGGCAVWAESLVKRARLHHETHQSAAG